MKTIEGTNGKYVIYENGEVVSVKTGCSLKHMNFGAGYKSVAIYRNGKFQHQTIHRLLAEAFIPNPENKPVVNHLNGIKDDNRLQNLKWATYSENNKHAFNTGLNKVKQGSERHTSTINEEKVYEIREMFKTKKISEISRELKLGYDLVRGVCVRKTWKHI